MTEALICYLYALVKVKSKRMTVREAFKQAKEQVKRELAAKNARESINSLVDLEDKYQAMIFLCSEDGWLGDYFRKRVRESTLKLQNSKRKAS